MLEIIIGSLLRIHLEENDLTEPKEPGEKLNELGKTCGEGNLNFVLPPPKTYLLNI